MTRLSSAETTTETGEVTAPETDERREGLVESLRDELGDAVLDHHLRPGDDLWVRVTADAWQAAGRTARDRLDCRFFTFLSALDWMPSPWGRDEDSQEDLLVHGPDTGPTVDDEPQVQQAGYAGGDTRFQVLARVDSPLEGYGITLKVDVPDDDLRIDSWSTIYRGANWHERETWEMFGIVFTGHPYLQNLYLPSGFEGHPLRKDFPLLARRVKPWPGLVDVEAMPDEDEDDTDGADEGEG